MLSTGNDTYAMLWENKEGLASLATLMTNC